MSDKPGSKAPLLLGLGASSSLVCLMAIALAVYFVYFANKTDTEEATEAPTSSSEPTPTSNNSGSGGNESNSTGSGAAGGDAGISSSDATSSTGGGSSPSANARTTAPGVVPIQGARIKISGGFCAAANSDGSVMWMECNDKDKIQRWSYRATTGGVTPTYDETGACLTHDAQANIAKLSTCNSPASTDQRWGLVDPNSTNLRPMNSPEKCFQAANNDPAANPKVAVGSCGVTESSDPGKSISNIGDLVPSGTGLQVFPPGQRPRTLSIGGRCLYGDTDDVRAGAYCLPDNTAWTYAVDGTLRWKNGNCLSLDTSTSYNVATAGSKVAMKPCAAGNPEQQWKLQNGKLKNNANTKYCAVRNGESYALASCDASGADVSAASSELFTDLPPTSILADVMNANTDSKDQSIDRKQVRFRSVTDPKLCITNGNGRVTLVPCDNAHWYYYDTDTKNLSIHGKGGPCIRHMGNATDLVHDARCPADDVAIKFKFDKLAADPRKGRIAMTAVNQCVDIPRSDTKKNLQTFWCKDAGPACRQSNGAMQGGDGTPTTAKVTIIPESATFSEGLQAVLGADEGKQPVDLRFHHPTMLNDIVSKTSFTFRNVYAVRVYDTEVEWGGERSTFPSLQVFEISRHVRHATFKAALFGLRHMSGRHKQAYGRVTFYGDCVRATYAVDARARREMELAAIKYFIEEIKSS